MSNNSNLSKAKNAKNDEFYTMMKDIEAELCHYTKFFAGKKVYCNCDDPEKSQFVKYFKDNFESFGLKSLTATHYTDDIDNNYIYRLTENQDTQKLITTKTKMICNGDFRSQTCIELLKECDIVVTNPPFSLFREYIAQLVEYDKKFVIVGNMNAVTYKEIFPLLKEGKMFAGYRFNKTMEFTMPNDYELKGKAYIDDSGVKHGFVPAICWFTNFDIDKRHEPLDLRGNYYKGHEDEYPKYDNYDAINVDKVNDIPIDYVPCWFDCPNAGSCEWTKQKGMNNDAAALCEAPNAGNMGVPITFMDKHDPEQFEIVAADFDVAKRMEDIDPNGKFEKGGPAFYLRNGKFGTGRFYINDSVDGKKKQYHRLYKRIVIRRKA